MWQGSLIGVRHGIDGPPENRRGHPKLPQTIIAGRFVETPAHGFSPSRPAFAICPVVKACANKPKHKCPRVIFHHES